MSDTPLPLPEGLRWIKLVCRLGRLAHDGVDPDDKPDLLPTAGKVRLASSPARLRVQEADGRWRSVSLDDREYTIRADGELVDTEGRVGVWIPDPASELLDPRPYTLVATVTPAAGERWAAKITGETLPDVVDLVAHSETVAVPASAVPGLSSRIASVEAILADGGAGTGSGVTVTDTPAVPAEGQSASCLVTSAVTWPAGLVWSDDPDGGMAPAITGTALVSLFTVGGTTRAIMGATFPALPASADTTAPSIPAGLSATAASSTSVTLAWSASTDDTAVTGYEYRVGGGAAVDAGAGLTETVTGLTASTLYSFEVRAYDAAGNRSGWSTAASATTSAPPADSAPPTVGSMTASSITETGFTLTVSGASDAVALHATPYAFTTDGGSTWSAYQASPDYVASGLTAATGYSCNWRVRDAAGNVSTGTAQTVTTGSGVDTTPPVITSFTIDESTGATVVIGTDSEATAVKARVTHDVDPITKEIKRWRYQAYMDAPKTGSTFTLNTTAYGVEPPPENIGNVMAFAAEMKNDQGLLSSPVVTRAKRTASGWEIVTDADVAADTSAPVITVTSPKPTWIKITGTDEHTGLYQFKYSTDGGSTYSQWFTGVDTGGFTTGETVHIIARDLGLNESAPVSVVIS